MEQTQVEVFPWNDNFATGIAQIDTQHRRLIELLNTLVSHLAFHADAPALEQVFDELRRYTAEHFEAEQRIWNQYFEGDPWEEWHKKAHTNFIDKVREIRLTEARRPSEQVIEEIVSFLTHWLAHHIIESDQRMAKVVLALPTGISLEQAKEMANLEMSGATRVLIDTVMGMYDKLANRTIQLSREINRRVQAEERFRAAQQELLLLKDAAVAASQAKSDFLANMSHEIRTPLSGVMGMTELLFNTPLAQTQRNMVHIIRDSTESLTEILNDVLDFSKIEAGKMDLLIEVFSPRTVLEKTTALLRGHASLKGVTLTLELAPDLPAAVEGAPLRLRQILSNFLTNAIKFSSGLDRPGAVLLRARSADEEAQRVWIEFSVRDNGIGMDADSLGRLFIPYAQADAGIVRQYGGTGLGLIISRRLAEMMGGAITVDSTLNMGSTFTLRLPFARADATRLVPAAEAEPFSATALSVPEREAARAQGRLVLVAEDNETCQEVIRQQLHMLGLQLDIAADGRDALARWHSGDYAVLLTDVHMPGLNGYDLAAAIRQEEQNRDLPRVPIVALTANALQGEAQRCVAVGIDDYLPKPVTLPQLKALFDKWLPGARLPSSVQPYNRPDAEDLPILDPMMLTRMVGNHPALHQRLLDKFDLAARQYAEQLRAACSSGDEKAVAAIAHAFKSSARTVGAHLLGHLCEQIEEAAQSRLLPSCGSLISAFDTALTATLAAVQVRLRQGDSHTQDPPKSAGAAEA